MNKLSPTELGWVAGLLEGEGCFTDASTVQKGKEYRYSRIQLNMTDEDVMRKFVKMVGIGRLSGPHGYATKTNWKPRWTWTVRHKDAKDLMTEILPLMGERRSEAIRASLLI